MGTSTATHPALATQLLVVPSICDGGDRTPIPADVVRVGRYWITLQEVAPRPGFSSRRTWRMDSRTQDDGTGMYAVRYVTPEQHAADQRDTAADAYLKQAGIRLLDGCAWRSGEGRIILANLLRAHEGLPPL
ncbi:beta barrel domain-containing protein [Streptomyces venezuelae]|uniref:beta barrel domain-containing protein n=1 Tax=Streptomyces venezuelae TaxID=54571 RepID=UPI003425C329